MKFLLVLVSALVLSSCAYSTRQEAGRPLDPAGLTSIVGRDDRESPNTWQSFIPIAIDSKAIKHSFFSSHANTVVPVEPGIRRIVVRAAFNTGGGTSNIKEAIILLVAPVEAGKAYQLNGLVRDHQLVVWLEDLTNGQRLAGEAAGNWAQVPQQKTVPIFIPVKK